MRFLLAVALVFLVAISGCVVRELIIKSDPPGATVYLNGRKTGVTPFRKTFDFYGARQVELRMHGYKTFRKIVTPPVPWYEFFPLDLFFEVVIPVRLYDRHEYTFTLDALPDRPPQELLERANKVRPGD